MKCLTLVLQKKLGSDLEFFEIHFETPSIRGAAEILNLDVLFITSNFNS